MNNDVRKLINNPCFLNDDEIRELVSSYLNGNSMAFDRLSKAFIPLINSIAREFKQPMLYEDLFQEGIIGFEKALKSYDIEKAHLSIYAKQYIKREMSDFVLNNKTPLRLITTKSIRKIFFNISKYTDGRGNVDKERMSTELDVTIEQINQAIDRFKTTHFSEFTNDDGERESIQDMIACEWDNIEAYEDSEELNHKQKNLKLAINSLNDRQRNIITKRYLTNEPPTLTELSDEYGVSLQRIQQIEKESIHKIQAKIKSL